MGRVLFQTSGQLTIVVLLLFLDNKVDYDNNEMWSEWNRAAKLRILMEPSRKPPMEQYYIEHISGGRTATPLSSLDASVASNDGLRSAHVLLPCSMHAILLQRPRKDG